MKRSGSMIRTHREKKGMTVQEVAAALGVKARLVTKWDNGRAMPNAAMIEQLSALLDIPDSAWIGAVMQKLERQRRSLLITVIALIVALLLSLGGIGIHARQYVRQMREIMEYVLYGGFGALESDYAVGVSMAELIATPERYHGVKVRLVAVGNLDFEGNCISASKEAWENYTNDRIWIELSEQLAPHAERLRRYNGEYVIIEGVFNMYDKGHFDMFQGALHNVTRYDLDDAILYDNCQVQYSGESGLYSYSRRESNSHGFEQQISAPAADKMLAISYIASHFLFASAKYLLAQNCTAPSGVEFFDGFCQSESKQDTHLARRDLAKDAKNSRRRAYEFGSLRL